MSGVTRLARATVLNSGCA